MKKINLILPSTYTICCDTKTAFKTLEDTGKVIVGHLDVGASNCELDVARENGAQVVYATIGVQNKLDEIITLHFFGPFIGPNDQRDFFTHQVLHSSRLDFAFKKDLAQKIIEQCDLLDGKDRNTLQGTLKKIMDWRNAIAHGRFDHNNQLGVVIHYFSGGPQTQQLNDSYWSDVETRFQEANDLLMKAIRSATRPSDKCTQQGT